MILILKKLMKQTVFAYYIVICTRNNTLPSKAVVSHNLIIFMKQHIQCCFIIQIHITLSFFFIIIIYWKILNNLKKFSSNQFRIVRLYCIKTNLFMFRVIFVYRQIIQSLRSVHFIIKEISNRKNTIIQMRFAIFF